MEQQVIDPKIDGNSDKVKTANQTSISSKKTWHSDIQLLLTFAGAIGIPAIFLHFSWSTSPYDLILPYTSFELWWMALPAFLPVLVFFASLRWIFKRSPSKTEHSVAYLASASSSLMVCFTLYNWIREGVEWPIEIREGLSIVFPIITLGLGIFILVTTRRNRLLNPFRSIFCMQIAYIANSLMFLVSYWGGWQNNSILGGWQVGAYCFLITVLVYSTQIILILGKFKKVQNVI